MDIDIHILNKSGRLSGLESIIKTGFETAISAVKSKLEISAIDVVFLDSEYAAIPETGVGGNANTPYCIVVSINPKFPEIQSMLQSEIESTLAHELHHCIRMRSVSSYGNLLEAAITEGLADHFDIEVNNSMPRPWDMAISGEELDKLMERARSEFYNSNYDHFSWFFGSKALGIPRWAGYTIGFQLVKDYLEKTNQKASALVTHQASEFIN